jgi:hypothetical protein
VCARRAMADRCAHARVPASVLWSPHLGWGGGAVGGGLTCDTCGEERGETLVHYCVFAVCAGRSVRSGSCKGRLRVSPGRILQGEMLPGLR